MLGSLQPLAFIPLLTPPQTRPGLCSQTRFSSGWSCTFFFQ